MLTSKKIVITSKYHISDKNKRKHKAILKAQLDFKCETKPMDKGLVLHRMSYDKGETYYPSIILQDDRNRGDLGDYLAYIGFRSVREPLGSKHINRYFRDDDYNDYFFNLNKRKLRLIVKATSKNINSNLEDSLDLKSLNNFILTGELPEKN